MLKTIRHLFQEEFADLSAMDSKKETVVEEIITEEPIEKSEPAVESGLSEQLELMEESVEEMVLEEQPVQSEKEVQMQSPSAAMDEAEHERSVIDEAKGESILELSISEIQVNPFQPRLYFDPAQLEELSSSIKEYGVLQPVIVRVVDGRYQLVSGERRFRASKLAQKETIPALIRQLSDREVAEMALIENLQREDLNYFEEAEGYARLIQEFQITQEEVAKKMGKSQPTIANKLRLLQISEKVRREISVDVITERHVRSLLKLKNEEQQLDVLNRIYKNNLNVRQTDDYIETLLIAEEKNIREQKKKKNLKFGKWYFLC